MSWSLVDRTIQPSKPHDSRRSGSKRHAPRSRSRNPKPPSPAAAACRQPSWDSARESPAASGISCCPESADSDSSDSSEAWMGLSFFLGFLGFFLGGIAGGSTPRSPSLAAGPFDQKSPRRSKLKGFRIVLCFSNKKT